MASQKIWDIFIQAEKVADQILVNKQEILEYSKQKEKIREALKYVKNSVEPKVWITIGTLTVKMEKNKAVELLEKDQRKIDMEINKLRSDQKLLVNKHRDLEMKQPYSGTNLKPLNSTEIQALRSHLPLS